jgi:hypothetical protein
VTRAGSWGATYWHSAVHYWRPQTPEHPRIAMCGTRAWAVDVDQVEEERDRCRNCLRMLELERARAEKGGAS